MQAVKLYERCLIPCANYSEFWIRYSEYVDAKGGREIANHALGRASSCFAKVSLGNIFDILHLPIVLKLCKDPMSLCVMCMVGCGSKDEGYNTCSHLTAGMGNRAPPCGSRFEAWLRRERPDNFFIYTKSLSNI